MSFPESYPHVANLCLQLGLKSLLRFAPSQETQKHGNEHLYPGRWIPKHDPKRIGSVRACIKRDRGKQLYKMVRR